MADYFDVPSFEAAGKGVFLKAADAQALVTTHKVCVATHTAPCC